MSLPLELRCFVIMPFGEKADMDGRVINFDVVYRYIIRDAIAELRGKENLKIECLRCDDIDEAGSIDVDMFSSILDADIAIVDITTGNPNVFYELGIRHSLRDNVTVIIRREGGGLPFNIQGLRVIDYDPANIESFDRAKTKIQRYVVNGLRQKRGDSPIRAAIPNMKVSLATEPLKSGETFVCAVRRKESVSIGVITGELEELRGMADIWVNSENTDLQLARFHEPSISGVIRYLGARKDRGRIVEDCIRKAVEEKTPGHAEGYRQPVDPGSVIVTDSGELKDTHGVKLIFHAATVQGTPGKGYLPVPNDSSCVKTALSIADSENEKREEGDKLKSILFPVFGTGQARGDYRKAARKLISAALTQIENHGSTLEKIYFLAYDRSNLLDCLDVLEQFCRDLRLSEVKEST